MRGYPPVCRRKVLDLVASGRSITDVARDLGIGAQPIYVWRRQDQVDKGLEPGLTSAEQAELSTAKRRITQLEIELAIHRRASELIGKIVPQRRFESIEVMAQDGLPVQIATRVLGVAESGYYEFRRRKPSARAVRHAMLTDVIREVHRDSRGTYGARRVRAELVLGRGLVVSHGTVELLMN